MPGSHQTSSSTYVRSLLRIVTGFMFSMHGAQKLFGVLGGHVAHTGSLLWIGAVLELAGGFLIVLGLFTRPVAFILCGEMAYAYFFMHDRRGFWPIQNGGELAVLYCFVFLYLFAAGGGAVSLDRMLRHRD